jgi:RNA polymerase sigma factor (TIGR02999 family)
MADVTQILSQIEQGDPSAANQLLALIYDELRKLAAARLAAENPGQTLQATALVHEAYVRLIDVQAAQRWDSRGHFFAAGAEAMRRILIERARKKASQKRGGKLERLSIDAVDIADHASPEELLLIDEVLEALAKHDPSAAEVVKLRYFAGLTINEVAESLGMSRRTIYRHWNYARAWLSAELNDCD